MGKIFFFLEIKFYFFSTFRKFTVEGFVNQRIKNSGLKFTPVGTAIGRQTHCVMSS